MSENITSAQNTSIPFYEELLSNLNYSTGLKIISYFLIFTFALALFAYFLIFAKVKLEKIKEDYEKESLKALTKNEQNIKKTN
jgi:hypothetical protein